MALLRRRRRRRGGGLLCPPLVLNVEVVVGIYIVGRSTCLPFSGGKWVVGCWCCKLENDCITEVLVVSVGPRLLSTMTECGRYHPYAVHAAPNHEAKPSRTPPSASCKASPPGPCGVRISSFSLISAFWSTRYPSSGLHTKLTTGLPSEFLFFLFQVPQPFGGSAPARSSAPI